MLLIAAVFFEPVELPCCYPWTLWFCNRHFIAVVVEGALKVIDSCSRDVAACVMYNFDQTVKLLWQQLFWRSYSGTAE